MILVALLDQMSDCEPYRLAWHSLYQNTRGASFFHSLDWLRLYWRHFGARQQLRVYVVSSDREVIGIVPLVVRTERTRVGSVKVLTFPLDDWGSFFGPVGPHPAATLSAALRFLRRQPRDWDLLDLRWINRQEIDFGRTGAALESTGFAHRTSRWRTTAQVDLAGGWVTYLASRSSGFRSNLRRAEAAAQQAGKLSFERYRPTGDPEGDPELRWDLYEECVELAETSWQGASATGTTISHASVRGYFRELFELAGRSGALDLNLLRLNGRLIAYTYNVHCQGEITGMRLGYAPDHAALSPGRLLLARSIEDSCRRGDRRLDLGPDNLVFKRAWSTKIVDSYRHIHYPIGSWQSQALRLKHWLFDRSNHHIADRECPTSVAMAAPVIPHFPLLS